MTSDSDLKTRHDVMAKMRDDARERGMVELAWFYLAETLRLGAERIMMERKRISEEIEKRKESGGGDNC